MTTVTYCFICSCGKKQEVVRSMSESDLPVLCDKDGFVMDRNFSAELGPQRHGDIWPMESYAAGVHPKQIPEMREFDKKNGVPTDYSEDGDPILRGPGHRKKYCEAHGLHDRNAGYSDPVPARCR